MVENHDKYHTPIREALPRVNSAFSSIYIRMDSKMKNIERDVHGLLDIFGTVGGIQELLIAFIGSIYAFFYFSCLNLV